MKHGVGDEELMEAEMAILRGDGDTIAGTGGLKKLRCRMSGRGKSGSIRLIVADFPRFGRAYLLAAFGKNEKANLSAAERNQLRMVKTVLEKALQKGQVR